MVQHENQGKISRGRVKVILIRELALGATPKRELANRFEVSLAAVVLFEKRHAEDITAARDDLESEWVGLWVADKRNRIAELQQLIEDMSAQVAGLALNSTPFTNNNAGVPLLKLLSTMYRQVAEELGQLPKADTHATQPAAPIIQYEYPGVLPGALG